MENRPVIKDLDDADSVRQHFKQRASEYSDARRTGYTFLTQKRAVLRLLEGREGKVLDVGCGAGHMLYDLQQQGFETYGVDAIKEWVDIAKDNIRKIEGQTRIYLSVADVEKLPFSDCQFDAIICMGVLEFLSSYEPALREMYRVSKPNGITVITVPSKIAPYFLSRALFSFLAKLIKFRKRSVSDNTQKETLKVRRAVPWRLDRIMRKVGFKKVSSEYCNFVFYLLNKFAPRVSLTLSKKLEGLSQSRLLGWLGRQYIIASIRI